MKKHLPNILTCCNLFSGCIAAYFAFQGELSVASYFIFLCLLFDYLDGFIARLLNVSGELGKQLDSLADVISFGLVPGIMLQNILLHSDLLINSNSTWVSFSAYLITIFSAVRLGKFNLDTRQTENFIGLPTPACAMLISSIPFILAKYDDVFHIYIFNPRFLLPFILFMCFLLVAELPLFSLKFKTYDLNKNLIRYIFLLSSIILFLSLNFSSIPIIIFIYILLSFIDLPIFKQKTL